ncbi:hypothetical protein GCM10018980_71190 [Streptomyces capoamus]|uniref:Uncharacterized protein n=1 Tax=Streptomyces capoamus TaxID=68183 RepID=A0A919F2Y1_9ACTN|nr:hypothetical protein [Streptomyces capoamus]GGW13247.1 hypothetical protein GCM10010501_16040 [Streptomyces libani subsp. rufus]GHG74356.1 hypothetical protein GCM10018980_71190 [Streptomyces capoamus]
MGAGDATPEVRLERLRASLTGTSKNPRAARWSTQGHANVLVGAALHAADRLRQGQTLTELERRLVNVLGAVLPEQEIRAWGGVYREAVQSLGSQVAVVPAVISQLPVTTGFQLSNLKEVLPALAREHAARPNTAVVSRESVAAGGPADSDAFVRGLSEYGFGATVFDRFRPASASAAEAGGEEQQAQDAGPAAASFRVKLELENFRCIRAVGDQWGGKDEIYWSCSTGSDKQAGTGFISQEFGAMKAGQSRAFDTSRRTVFDGQASEGLMLAVSVWEADQSPPQWAKALMELLVGLSDYMFSNWGWMLAGMLPGGYSEMVLGIAAEIATMFAWVVVHARNDDDLSCTRVFLLDQYDLALLSYGKGTDWHFNGLGHHVLKVKYSGNPVPFPTGQLQYAVRTGNTWSAPVTLPWESMTPPAVNTYNNHLYVLYVRPGDKAVMWTRHENGTWRTPERIGNDVSFYAPSVGVAHGKLYYAVTGTNDGLYWRTFNGTSWSGISRFDGYTSAKSPTLAISEYRGDLWLTHIGPDGRPWINYRNANNWSPSYAENSAWVVDRPVAMAPHQGRMWRLASGTDQTLHATTSEGGAPWKTASAPGGVTRHGPALAIHDNKMWIFVRGTDGKLYSAINYNERWETPLQRAGDGTGIDLRDEPSAISHQGRLYVMYRR